MVDLIDRKSVIDMIHKAIFDFFDIVDDDDESPMTYKDEQLLTLNKAIVTKIKALPSAQPNLQPTCNQLATDTISRQAAIDAVDNYIGTFDAIDVNFLDGLKTAKKLMMQLPSAQPTQLNTPNTLEALECISRQAAYETLTDYYHHRTDIQHTALREALNKVPSAQPERLTNDDFETIRIHLNAYKEKLCNQHRWEEAEEYQRIIDRFMSFASAQPDVPDTNVGDMISRQAAIMAVLYGPLGATTIYGRTEQGMAAQKETVQAIRMLPSAVRHGTWSEDGGELKCSECHSIFFNDIMDMNKDEMPSFCPVCGATMDGEQHE